ncbi:MULTISPECIES: HAD family phosphatase [unclassified Oceanobacter]|jgi:HAD superfamily hydrolase (TIGR01490 family)|uniref:HAD family hydrolase n=1 Tax=unclassified Oceanobacter TaxID=2620260 RepID=UPI0026E3F8B3|nr:MULTISPECIES: HAD-IB family phosphatase [unclassified Oceanobacter]MDO6681640.1 HAD-IB family phosphatase [Oceanobacter sp. 5_MG-2023]MDP2505732.1 HAD-IB family phosphatase [Oceanobacter sp. 3_MG-2023]MDP2547441.1 HAD-IB family phosphatase [Oceanobacter sp. 4_MG-2023]MDP2608229.1 HAD-IB family phosphatase [Oceanobacter sp. 1_MG-2023]MDP2612955.1 HAD-IB family phosphatase [Oceanobacter sp. 2_MG-2023]
MQVYKVKVVFFDLDDSLINKDANSLWIKWRVRRERWALVEATLALASLYRAYKKGRVTHWRLSNYYKTRARGMALSVYQQRVAQFFAERGHLHIYPQAASLLFAYQRQGVELVMITGADDYVARAYADALGITHVISNRLKVVNDRIVGLQRPLCYGSGKVGLARAFLRERGLKFSDAAFYTDSHADLPLLEKVAQPVVLNPNARLRDAAALRSWPCLDWRPLKN